MSVSGDRFVAALIEAMGLTPSLLDVPGVSVAPAADRAGTRAASGYQIGRQMVLWCDPALADRLGELAAAMEPNRADWASRAQAAGAELVGSAEMTTMGDGGLRTAPVASGYEAVSLDRDRADHVALLERFIASVSPEDADEAELEIDHLDPIIRVLVDQDGEIAAFAGAVPWPHAPGFSDIGVVVRPNGRGRGLGRAVVAATCKTLLAAGVQPLYCFNDLNEGSRRLSAGLGFERATALTAYKFS